MRSHLADSHHDRLAQHSVYMYQRSFRTPHVCQELHHDYVVDDDDDDDDVAAIICIVSGTNKSF